jgi:large subunit ribosomal protein L9
MEVILLEKIHRLGNLGDKVSVRAGHGRNYLVPQGKAVPATDDNLAKFEQQRAELERAQADLLGSATARAEHLVQAAIKITAKAGSEGKLFGSVGGSDIAAAMVEAGFQIEKREIRLPDGPLRELGDYQVDVHLHADVNCQIAVSVVPEDAIGGV